MVQRKKVAQHKTFAVKWFYILLGIVIGYFASIKFPVKETLTFFDTVNDYISESALLMAVIVSFVTSYLKRFWSKRSEDR